MAKPPAPDRQVDAGRRARPRSDDQPLHEPTYLEFARNPRELEERLAAQPDTATVCIDEVQRLATLLNTIQVLFDRPGNRQGLRAMGL